MKTDFEIRKDVEEELRWDPDIDPTDIAVKVNSGIVALTGFVRNYSDKYEAEVDAKRVAGVHGVANDLEVRLPTATGRPDPELARDAVAALKTQLPFSWEDLKVIVKEGWVTLEGELEWNYQRDMAESAMRRLPGIRGISNFTTLKAKVMPREVKHRIIAAFHRSAQIDANRVSVETSDGQITLKGSVRSWAEREEAQRAAWATPGVNRVDNQITVSG
jgi:osmotically-inducible protein OsmY